MKKALTTLVCSFLAASPFLHSQTIWDGSESSDWFNPDNWSAGVPTDASTAIFSGAVTNQPSFGAGAAVQYLEVTSGGWIFNSDDGAGGVGDLDFHPLAGNDAPYELNITGAGLTIINGNLVGDVGYRGPDIFLSAGSKLVINGDVRNPTGRAWRYAGTGYYVFNGDIPDSIDLLPMGDGLGNSGTYIYNSSGPANIGRFGVNTITSGQTLGGTTPTLSIYQYINLAFDAGSTLSPGGDGATMDVDGYDGGALISSMTFESSSATIRAGVDMESGSKLEMDLGTTAGVSDQIIIGFLTDDFDLGGVELALRSTGVLQNGDYTLLTETLAGSDYLGTFGTITFDGELADPEDFSLAYNSDSIVLTVSNMIPQPSSTSLLILGFVGVTLFRRRVK